MAFGAALHGDVTGYSALIAHDESATFGTLQGHRAIIEAVVAVHSGEMASFTGDEFLAVLPTAREAVDAAVQIQREIAIENERLAPGRHMRFRLGIHSGELHHEEGGWYGDVVNIAARLQAEADPGGISISGDAMEEAGELDVEIASMGALRLKNIPEPVFAYRLLDDQLAAAGGRLDRAEVQKRPSLAVLRFINLGAEEDEHFADGLMVSLLVELMTIPGLDVISDSSVLSLGRAVSARPEAATRVGARYALEGAVQKDGDRVRVMVQLIDTSTSVSVWADRFESSVSGLFAAQDELVNQIAAAVEVEGIQELKAGAAIYRDEMDDTSVKLIYKGWQAFIEGTPEGLRRARELFEEVTERTPESAIGWSVAAWTYLWEDVKGWVDDPEPNIARAKELALKAEELGDPSGFSSAVLAYVHVSEHDWDSAYEAATKATAERPSCDVTFGVASSVMRYLGRWEDAVEMGNRASELSPLLTDWYQSVVANAYFVGGDYQSATAAAESVVATEDDEIEALLTLAASQAALGWDRQAAATIRQARQANPKLSADVLRDRLPYKDEATREAFLARLQEAGLD
jgi:TolB-like protein